MINARRWCRGWVRHSWIRAAFPEEATLGIMNIQCGRSFLVEGTADAEVTDAEVTGVYPVRKADPWMRREGLCGLEKDRGPRP